MQNNTAGLDSNLKRNVNLKKGFLRFGWVVSLLVSEAAIFIFGAYYFDIFSTNKNLTYSLILSAVFLTGALWFKNDTHMEKYWQIPFALFIASTAFPITDLMKSWIRMVLEWFAVTTDTSQGLAIEKVCEMLIKVLPILALVKTSGADFGSVYIKRGNLKLGMGIGWLVFFFLAPASFMFAT